MENDQIKSQIENAKKAFIAGVERNREVISSELDTADTKVQKDLVPEDRQLTEEIMSRVRGLMDEATQTSKGVTREPFISKRPVAESRAKPFWAQNRADIPPSEQFGKRQKCKTRMNRQKQPVERSDPVCTFRHRALGWHAHPRPADSYPAGSLQQPRGRNRTCGGIKGTY